MNAGGIWITGAGGLIGSWLVRTADPKTQPRVIALTRPQLELGDFAKVTAEFRRQKPSAVLHCAAMSRSPACQAEPALARKLNVELTAMLAELAADIPFLFFSTDLVFDGRAGNYNESAPVNPLSVYAETKALAEARVLRNTRHLVVRTSLNCGASPTRDRGLDEQLCRAWEQGQTLRMFTDEFRSPIAAEVTARAVWELMAHNCAGLFHVAGAERLSRWEIGQIVARLHPELKPRLEPASAKEYSGAPRPPDTSLNCAKAQRLLSFPLPRFSEWTARCVTQPQPAR